MNKAELYRQCTTWVRDGIGGPNAPGAGTKVEVVHFTLTMAQGRTREDGTVQLLRTEDADREIEILLADVNSAVFGNAARRHGKRLYCFTVNEGGGLKRLHRHLLLRVPSDRMSARDFVDLVKKLWARSPWAMKQVEAVRCYDLGGVVRYLIKTGIDAPDLNNCTWGDDPRGRRKRVFRTGPSKNPPASKDPTLIAKLCPKPKKFKIQNEKKPVVIEFKKNRTSSRAERGEISQSEITTLVSYPISNKQ